MESHIWYLPAGSVALLRRAQKRDSGFCLPFHLGENCPPALSMPDTSVPPFMPLLLFKLLSQCWSSERMSLSKSLHGLFKRNCLGLQKFPPPTQSPLIFATRSHKDLSFCHCNPGLGSLVWGWGFLTPKILLPKFYLPHVYVGPICPVFPLLLPVWKDVDALIP